MYEMHKRGSEYGVPKTKMRIKHGSQLIIQNSLENTNFIMIFFGCVHVVWNSAILVYLM